MLYPDELQGHSFLNFIPANNVLPENKQSLKINKLNKNIQIKTKTYEEMTSIRSIFSFLKNTRKYSYHFSSSISFFKIPAAS